MKLSQTVKQALRTCKTRESDPASALVPETINKLTI